MKKTILLTGGSGDLGQVLSVLLNTQGHACTRLDIRPPADKISKYVEYSILKREGLAEHFQDVDVIVHIAAWHGVHAAHGWKNRDQFWNLNVTGTYNVFQASVDAGVDKLIYISSSSVEDPQEFYGFTKRMGETVALEYAERHGLNVIILRPRAFIPHWNRVVYDSFLEWAQWFGRGAVHIDDVGRAVLLCIDKLLQKKLAETPILTIDGAYEYSDADLDNWDAAGYASSFRKYYDDFYPMVAEYDLNVVAKPTKKDSSAAKHVLGYKPEYGLRNLLEELREFGVAGPPHPKI